MYRLIIYDTSNFVDFPIGGQLTSIANFLKYITEKQKDIVEEVLLVGVTTNETEIGKLQTVDINGMKFDFFPVLYRSKDLNKIKKSMRLEYLKALFKFSKYIPNSSKTIHYIHTPEAFIQIKIKHPKSKTAVFSHGSFFNMVEGFRFYKNNKFIKKLFNKFLIWLIKKADIIFTLDAISTEQYIKYNKQVYQVNNSVELPKHVQQRMECHSPVKLLFVGRLSKVKKIDTIIDAVALYGDNIKLTIVGDGEEKNSLQNCVINNQLQEKIIFTGAVSPKEVANYIRENDILVMNSIFEGKPMTILEAMSYGMPIVTTPVGGITEMVVAGENGEYTNASAKSIVEKLNIIIENYMHYSLRALELSKKFDYVTVNEKIFEEMVKLCK